jgi:haloalkane dehalogenase
MQRRTFIRIATGGVAALAAGVASMPGAAAASAAGIDGADSVGRAAGGGAAANVARTSDMARRPDMALQSNLSGGRGVAGTSADEGRAGGRGAEGGGGRLEEGSEAGTARDAEARAWAAARRFVATGAGEIAVVERGRGPLAALFLHGFPLNSYQWRGAVERLAPYRRCIAPDFLGLGHTRVAPGQSLAPQAQADMLAELLDKLQIRKVDLIANDSGGAVAQIFLARHPQRVRSLLLTNCDTEIDCPPPALQPVIEMSKSGTFADQWFEPWLADKNLARSSSGIGGMCFERPEQLSDATLEAYLRPLVSTPQRKQRMHAYAVALEANSLSGIGPVLKASQAPVRVLWGMADDIFLPHGADHLAKAFGNSQGVRRLAGAKLFWPEERPDLIAQEARALWQA